MQRHNIDDWAFDMDIIDANADQLPDLVLQSRIYENLGDGSWEPWEKEVGQLTDLNQDGLVDVVSRTDGLNAEFAVSHSDGNMSWLPSKLTGIRIEATDFYLGDTDGNGIKDLIFAVGNVDSEQPED